MIASKALLQMNVIYVSWNKYFKYVKIQESFHPTQWTAYDSLKINMAAEKKGICVIKLHNKLCKMFVIQAVKVIRYPPLGFSLDFEKFQNWSWREAGGGGAAGPLWRGSF